MVSPSATMSMLRSILWSLCSFLLRASRAWEVMSWGAGFTTFPPHSTLKWSNNRAYFILSTVKTYCTPLHMFPSRCSTFLCKVHLRCQSQWCPLFVWAQGTSHSICRSWIYRHRWTQSHMFPLPLLQSVHLMKQRGKLKCKTSLLSEIVIDNKNTYPMS